MDESILDAIKKLLGMDPEYDAFDTDAIIGINSIFSVLQQLGVGPQRSFEIIDNTATWADFFATTAAPENYSSVKSYIFLRVRMMFDPPANSFTQEAFKANISEMEWRLNVQAEGSFDD